MTLAVTAMRKKAWLNSGTLSPNPWDLTLLGRNVWSYNQGVRTEDRAPQGCAPSAASNAGMTQDGFDFEAVQKTNLDPLNINLFKADFGLDEGVHFKEI
jgi:hypothetical protein